MIDTNVISAARKGDRANRGVVAFLKELAHSGDLVFLASVTIGELRRGVELIRRRGDANQAERLEAWLESVVEQFGVPDVLCLQELCIRARDEPAVRALDRALPDAFLRRRVEPNVIVEVSSNERGCLR